MASGKPCRGARSANQAGYGSKRREAEVLNSRPVADLLTEGAVNELPGDLAGRSFGSPSETKGISRTRDTGKTLKIHGLLKLASLRCPEGAPVNQARCDSALVFKVDPEANYRCCSVVNDQTAAQAYT
jgi:hypothetical protein